MMSVAFTQFIYNNASTTVHVLCSAILRHINDIDIYMIALKNVLYVW